MGITTNKPSLLERISYKITYWIGTPSAIIIHSAVFLIFTILLVSGVEFNKVILIWNTTVSLEAIYLSLFLQMTVNRHTESLEDLEEEVEDISEDIEDIQEDERDEVKKVATLDHIEAGLQRLIQEVEALKARSSGTHPKPPLPQTH